LKSLKTHFEELLLETAKWKYYDELEEKNLEEIMRNRSPMKNKYIIV